jgi:hypothetical protein
MGMFIFTISYVMNFPGSTMEWVYYISKKWRNMGETNPSEAADEQTHQAMAGHSGLLVAIKDLKDEGTIGLPSGQPFIRQTHLAGVNYGSGWVKQLNPMNFTHVNQIVCVFSSSFGYLV